MNMEHKFLLLPRRSAGERNPVPPPKLLQMEDMPMWKTLPYDTKYPLQKVAKEDEKPLSKEIGKSLYDEYPNKDFDLRVAENPILPSISYNSLHDPHLRHFFQSTLRYRNLVKRGFVSKDGKVRFHLAQFNQYRMYLYHLWVMQVNQLRRNQVCEEKKRVKSVLEAHDSKDILCEKVLNKYDRIDIEAVLEELSARILQEHGFSPLARSLFRWKCYQDKLRKNYKECYPVMKQWLSAQTKNYRLLLESKLNARRNKAKKLRIRLEKLRESSRARLNRVTYLRQLQEDSRRIFKEERHKYFTKIWARNDRKMHLKKRKPVTKVDKKSPISEDTLLNYSKAKVSGFGLRGHDVNAQLQGFEIPFSSSVSESRENIILKKSCDTSERNTFLSDNTTNDEREKCFRKHPQVLDYSSVLNHRSEHETPAECPSVKEVNRHPSDLVKGTVSDFEAKDITVKNFQSHYLPSAKRPLKVLKKNNEDLRGTNKNNEDLRSKLLELSSSQSTTDVFEESLTEEEKNVLQTKASVSVRKRKLKSHERTSADPIKSSSIRNRLFSTVSKLQGKQMKKTESEKNKKKLEEDDLVTTLHNDSKRYSNRKFSSPECESSSSCATYGKQKSKQEVKLYNTLKEGAHSNSISRYDTQAENHISKLDQSKETKKEPCYDSRKQKQTKCNIELFQSEHTKLRQNNANKRHGMEYWTKEIDLDSDKASNVKALGLRTDMQKDIHLGQLNQLKQTKEEPCNKLRFQKQAERKSGTKSLESECKKIRRNSSLNQRKQQEIECWEETEKKPDKASEAEVRRFHSDRQEEINIAKLDQSEETKGQTYDQLKKQKCTKSTYSPKLFQSEQKEAKHNGKIDQIKQRVADYCAKKAEMESDETLKKSTTRLRTGINEESEKTLEASTSRLRTGIHEESDKTLETSTSRLRNDMHEDIPSSKLDQWKRTKDDKCNNLKEKQQAKAKYSFEALHSEQKKDRYNGTLNQMKQPERDYCVKETESESDEILKMEVSEMSNDDYPIINHFSPQEKQKSSKITWKMLENSLLERRKKYSDLNELDELKLKLKKNELIQKEFSDILKDYLSTTEIISRSVSCAKKGSKSETGNFAEKLEAFRSLTWKKSQTKEKQVLRKKDFSIERSFSNVRRNQEHHDDKITDEDYARIPSINGGITKTVERAGIKPYTGTKFTKTLAEDFVPRNNDAEIKKKVLKRFKDNFFIEMYMEQKNRLQKDLHDYFFTDSTSRSQVKRYYESATKDREESVGLHIDHYKIKEGRKIISQKQRKFEFDGKDCIHAEPEHKIAPHKSSSNIISGITKAEIQKPIEKFKLSKETEQIIKKKDVISRSCLEEEKLSSYTKVSGLGKEDNKLLSSCILNEDYHVDLISPEISEESISANEFYPMDNEVLSKTTKSEIQTHIGKSELSKETKQIIKKEDVTSRSGSEEENISSDAKVSELGKEEDNGLLSRSILNENYHVDLISPEISEDSSSTNELYPTDNELISKTTKSEIPKPIEKSELSKETEKIIKKEGVTSSSCLEEENILSDAKVSELRKEEDNGLLSTSILNEDYHVDLVSPEIGEESISANELYPTDNELLSKATKSEIPKPVEKSELSKETEQIIKKEGVTSSSCLEGENILSDAKVSELRKEEDNGLLSTSILNEDYHVDLISPEIGEKSIFANELYPMDNELLSKTTKSEFPKPIKSELSKEAEQIIKKKDVIPRPCLEKENISLDSKVSDCKKGEDIKLLSANILNEDYHVDLTSPEISEESISAYEKLYPTDNEMLSEITEAGIQKPHDKTELSQAISQALEKGGISKSRLEQARVLSYAETRKCQKDEEDYTLFSNTNCHTDLIDPEMSEECISAHEIYPTDIGSLSENLQKTKENFPILLKACAAEGQTTDFSADDIKYSSAALKDETIFYFSNVHPGKDKHSEISSSNVFISPYILHKNRVPLISSNDYLQSYESIYSDEGYHKRLEKKISYENALEAETVSTVFEPPLFPEAGHWNYDTRMEDVSNQILALQDRSNDNSEENRFTAQNSLDASEFCIVSTIRTVFEMPKFRQAELKKHDSVTSMNGETAYLCTPRIRKQESEKYTVNQRTCKENRASKKTRSIPLTVNDVTVKTDHTLSKKESKSYFKHPERDKFVCEKLPSAILNREPQELKFVSPESTKHTFTTIGEDNNTIRNLKITTEQTPVADLTKRNEPCSLPNKILTVTESCKILENSAVKPINVEIIRSTSINSDFSSTPINSFPSSSSTEATVTAMRMPTQTVSKFSAPTNDNAIQLFEETLLEPKWKHAQYICQIHSEASFSSSMVQPEKNFDIPANMIIPVNANETKTLQFRINESKTSIISDLTQLMEAYFSEYHRIRQHCTVEDALMLWKQRRSLEDIMKTSFFNIQNREWILNKAVEFINIKYTVMKTQDLDPDVIDLINLITLNFSLPHSKPIVKSKSIDEGFQNNTEHKKSFLHDIESKDIFIKSGMETLEPISSLSQLSNETALNKIIFTEINEQHFSTSNSLEISFGTYSRPVCVFSGAELESVPIHEFVSLEKTKLQHMLQFPKSVMHPQSVRIEEIYEPCNSDLDHEFISRYSTGQPTDNGENISSTDPSSNFDLKSDHSYVKDYSYSYDFTSNESDNNVIDIKRKIEKPGSLNIALEYLPETEKSASDDSLKPFLKYRKKIAKPSAQIPIYSDKYQAEDSERKQYQAQKMFETNEKDKILDIFTQTYPMLSERTNLDSLIQFFLLLNSFKTSNSSIWRINENLNLSELSCLQTFMRPQEKPPDFYMPDPKSILSLDSSGIFQKEQQYERFQIDSPSKTSEYDYIFSENVPQEEASTSEAISTINVLQLKRPEILCHLKASGVESIKLSVSRKDIQYLESESKALSSTIGFPKLEADGTFEAEVSNDAEEKGTKELPYSRARLSNATILSLIDDKIRSLEAYFSENGNDNKSE